MSNISCVTMLDRKQMTPSESLQSTDRKQSCLNAQKTEPITIN